MKIETLMNLGIELVERGWVPDVITRRAIRKLCTQRLSRLDTGEPESNRMRQQNFIADSRQSPIALVPEKANEQHYEVPAEFYTNVLGLHRKYSCCYWPEGVETLDDAEAAALRETCQHAEIQDGMSLLELGCGWGSLTLWMAENYPASRITAVSNSHSQREFIEQQATARGVADRVQVITADMNEFIPEGAYDRVVSVEMFEHMRNYEQLLQRISGWLNEQGKLLVHVFCHREFAYAFNDQSADDWMARHFFSGGIMPSDQLLTQFPEQMRVTKQWRWGGEHYQKTAEAWLSKLDQQRKTIMPILAATYGKRQAARWLIRWRLFFMAVAELFGYREGTEWYVSHYLLEPTSADTTKAVSVEREYSSF
ncbi:SAM-dependent methyltransferase [Gimesia algae]|uniref:Cyclopropane-fatty-acyl-phospholipid synthase n=1 Tax=Gimesia algae TaxID=2527971 RepID=A0A517VAN6_9PLAN|nr:cyclopropane-fatty-acyl-phospholipid synthase family protein [Gimesia algae]QDT90073.1 Cyclopropane-fatty-acyl-phospholipid synthase [Gimesia algae]